MIEDRFRPGRLRSGLHWKALPGAAGQKIVFRKRIHSRNVGRLWSHVKLSFCALLLATAPACSKQDKPQHVSPRPLEDSILQKIHGEDDSHELPPLDDPIIKTTDYHMRDDDAVFGVVVSGIARAYPWWIIKNYHVVNDTIGETPVLISFCEQCSSAAAFLREVDDQLLSMRTKGVYKGTIVLTDRETESIWSPFDGVAIAGKQKGTKLERLPIVLNRWHEWKTRHPETGVVFGNQWQRQGHGDFYSPGKWGIDDEMAESIDHWDTRLPENLLVLGILSDGVDKAYPLATLKIAGNVVNDKVGSTPVALFARDEFEASAYERSLDGQVLTFETTAAGGEAIVQDSETGSLWTSEGLAVQGPLKGKQLGRPDSRLSEWYEWSAYHPETEIYGRIDPDVQTNIGAKFQGKIVFPEVRLERLDTEKFASIETPAAINVIVLWSTWCPPCREAIPVLEQFVRAHDESSVAVASIAIHMASPKALNSLRKTVEQERLTFPVFLITESVYDLLENLCLEMNRFGIILPMAFIMDGDRRVQAVLAGEGLKKLPNIVENLARTKKTIGMSYK